MFIYALLAILYVIGISKYTIYSSILIASFMLQVGSYHLGRPFPSRERPCYLGHWFPPRTYVPNPHELLHSSLTQMAPHRVSWLDRWHRASWFCRITIRDWVTCIEIRHWLSATFVSHCHLDYSDIDPHVHIPP